MVALTFSIKNLQRLGLFVFVPRSELLGRQ
jgi:hypothetical protein